MTLLTVGFWLTQQILEKLPKMRNSSRHLLVCVSLALPIMATSASAAENERWLKKSGFGLMFHYEAFKNHSAASYNRTVRSFDVKRFADAVASTKAGHVIFVIGQHWGRYCAPNRAYEKCLGVPNGVWTSKRDLILEIARELKKRDVKLIIYMTARAPMRHYKIIKAMGDTLPTINGKPVGPKFNTMSHPRKVKGFRRSENQAPTPEFLRNWGDVCGEWSKRYGTLVSGWWFDGYKMEMKEAYAALKHKSHNVDTWITAVRSGNPKAELAFNAGAHPSLSLCTSGRLCPHQTFTSGESRGFYQRTKKGRGKALTPQNFPAPKGVIWHLLVPVGAGWGSGTAPRFRAGELADRVDLINSQGGTVTLDVPITADGSIPMAVLDVLQTLGKNIKSLRDGVRSPAPPALSICEAGSHILNSRHLPDDYSQFTGENRADTVRIAFGIGVLTRRRNPTRNRGPGEIAVIRSVVIIALVFAAFGCAATPHPGDATATTLGHSDFEPAEPRKSAWQSVKETAGETADNVYLYGVVGPWAILHIMLFGLGDSPL